MRRILLFLDGSLLAEPAFCFPHVSLKLPTFSAYFPKSSLCAFPSRVPNQRFISQIHSDVLTPPHTQLIFLPVFCCMLPNSTIRPCPWWIKPTIQMRSSRTCDLRKKCGPSATSCTGNAWILWCPKCQFQNISIPNKQQENGISASCAERLSRFYVLFVFSEEFFFWSILKRSRMEKVVKLSWVTIFVVQVGATRCCRLDDWSTTETCSQFWSLKAEMRMQCGGVLGSPFCVSRLWQKGSRLSLPRPPHWGLDGNSVHSSDLCCVPWNQVLYWKLFKFSGDFFMCPCSDFHFKFVWVLLSKISEVACCKSHFFSSF